MNVSGVALVIDRCVCGQCSDQTAEHVVVVRLQKPVRITKLMPNAIVDELTDAFIAVVHRAQGEE